MTSLEPDAAGRPVRVLSVPAHHPYVDAVRPAGVVAVAGDRTAGWEADPVFDHPDRFSAVADVVHVHFGFDAVEPEELTRWARRVRARARLVVTVHDLRNPHHVEPTRHDAQLGALLASADVVTTLTAGAADELARRFRRSADVLPHPAIHDGPTATTEHGTVGIALKSLRRNVIHPFDVASAVAGGAAAAGGHLTVTAHPGLDATLLAALRRLPATTVALHERLTDAAHRDLLSRLHVSVLPHRWGTHSGWLEACRDVGTAVVAPTCGRYADQWSAVRTYAWDEHRDLDADGLAAAVAAAVAAEPPAPVDRAVRRAQLAQVHAGLLAAYRADVCEAA